MQLDWGYDIALQFGIEVLPTRAGLVPFTLHPEPLAGVSCPVEVSCNGEAFREPMLVTHRGLSGPAMLQISSFWQPGDELSINLQPKAEPYDALSAQRDIRPQSLIQHYLDKHFAGLNTGAVHHCSITATMT